MLDRIGVNEDNFENFISSIYLHCGRIDDLAPHKIASYLEDLIAFSRTVPFSQIEKVIFFSSLLFILPLKNIFF
jgi:hypothetical protein